MWPSIALDLFQFEFEAETETETATETETETEINGSSCLRCEGDKQLTRCSNWGPVWAILDCIL